MEARFLADEQTHAMVEFIRRVWDKDITVERFLRGRAADLAENPYASDGGIPIAVVLDGEKIVGRLSAIPCRLWADGDEHRMYWLSGLHILAEARGKKLAPLLPKLMMDTYPIITGFFVQKAPLQIYRKLGWTIPGKIPEYMKILDARSFFDNFDPRRFAHTLGWRTKLASAICAAARMGGAFFPALLLKCHAMAWNARSQGRHPARVCAVDAFDRRIDRLWERNRTFIQCAQVRSSAYLNWRFKKEAHWIKVVSEAGDEIDAYAVVSVKRFSDDERLRGMTVLSVIDIFWDFVHPQAFLAMLRALESIARERGAAVMLCSIRNADAREMLRRSAFFRIPSTVYFGFHCAKEGLRVSPNFEDWFVTRGDADASGSLAPE